MATTNNAAEEMAPPSPKPNNVGCSSMELVLCSSDLVREILLRLPVKSIVKFQTVSKEWLSRIPTLISSAEFRRQHSIRQRLHSLILQIHCPRRQLFHLNPTNRRLTSLSLSNEAELFIIQSSNGLLLLQPGKWGDYFYVHNPATKQSRKIIPKSSTTHAWVGDVALAFDPSKSPYYQLVCLRPSASSAYFNWEGVTYLIEVYSSKSHTWEELTTLAPFSLPSFMILPSSSRSRPHKVYWNRVYWNNAIYWSTARELFYCCFNIAKGEMKPLRFPFSRMDEKGNAYCRYADGHDYSRLQESNGHVFHIELLGSEGGREVVAIWELELDGDDDHRWLLRQHHVLPRPPQWEWGWEPPTILTFLADTSSLLICRNGWTAIYNLNARRYEDFLDAAGNHFSKLRKSYHSGFQFGGTLALV